MKPLIDSVGLILLGAANLLAYCLMMVDYKEIKAIKRRLADLESRK